MPPDSQYIYRIRPTRPSMLSEGLTAEEESIISEHFTYLQRLTQEGIVLVCGRTMTTDESTFGIVIFVAQSEGDAWKIMENDPAVKRGVMKAELFPFRIALLPDGWKVPSGST